MTRANRLNRTAFCILLVFGGNLLAVPAMAASGCLSACCMRDAAPAGNSDRWMAASQGCCCGEAAETPCRLSENGDAGSTVFTLTWSRHTKTADSTVMVRLVDSPLSATATGGDLPSTPSRPPAGHFTPLYLQHQLFRI